VLVNGEHRIKFMALRDIGAGEELFFNYGKHFAEKQGLTKKLRRK
jgi:histone-lysine N-methyltransferase EZH2